MLSGESLKKYFQRFLWISLETIMVHIPNIPPFKGLDTRNLQYEIRICQKGHNKVTKTVLRIHTTIFYETDVTFMTIYKKYFQPNNNKLPMFFQWKDDLLLKFSDYARVAWKLFFERLPNKYHEKDQNNSSNCERDYKL